MRRLRHRLSEERGVGLVLAIGIMAVLSITATGLVYYATSNSRASEYADKSSSTYHVAESGVAMALSRLGNASNPRDPSLFPTTTTTTAGGTVTYSGTLSGASWTITSTASVPNPSSGAPITNTLSREVTIQDIAAGGLGPYWSRVHADTTDLSKCTKLKKLLLVVPFSARGCVKLEGSSGDPTRLLGSKISIGGYVELKDSDSIGLPGSPVAEAHIGGTCELEHSSPHSPCSAADRVYASTITTTPTDLARPTIDWTYWYNNAKPGPKQNCTTGSLPSGSEFDDNGAYDKSAKKMDLTPKSSSYTCQVWQVGELVGELSWNHVTRVLKVKGAIFFDGDVEVKDDGALINYQGKATLYGSGKWKSEELWCAGGNGTRNCRTDGIENWDPTQNLLVLVFGGQETGDHETIKMGKHGGGFQGAIYGERKCKFDKDFQISAPILCNTLSIKDDDDGVTLWPWPASLTNPAPGQVVPAPQNDFQLIIGNQTG